MPPPIYIHRSSFIGYAPIQSQENFSNTDSEEKFNASKLTQLPSWEYNTVNVSYKRNQFGHRCSEIENIDLNNYILFSGCSVTEGIGIPVETRYSNILAKHLKSDLYNLALAATGNDIIFYNIVSWLSVIKNKPKLIVIQWSKEQRFSTIKNDKTIIPTGPWNEKQSDFIISGTMNGYFDSKTKFYRQLIRKITGDIPLIEMADEEFSVDSIDYARDLLHPGIKTNEALAQKLYNHINTNLTLS